MKLALTNVPPDAADHIARVLVEEELVACVNLIPLRSVYRWKGRVCEEGEVALLMKVADAGVDRLRERLMGLHPYELPEFIVLPVESEGSLPAYLAWVDSAGNGSDAAD
jgi:periplasmic divalent cation tolerance protein